ncbi:acyl-CoA dehydrogenase [Streptomyces ipomoeae]|nr:acyl-CoA dehydrogenase [Streptomyces ipomoeae]
MSGEATTTTARDRFERFARTEVAPYAADIDLSGAVPDTVLTRLVDEELWGAVVHREAGGTGTGMIDFAVLHEEIGRACSSVRSLLTVHSMALFALARWGSPAARERLFDPMVRGDLRGAFCLTEPGAGSDVSLLETAAKPADGGGFTLHGTKQWITGGQSAHVLLVFARTERGITAFLVDVDRPGIERTPTEGVMGTRGSMLAEIRFDGCPVGPDDVIGAEGMGAAVIAGVLDIGRLSVAAGSVGITQACLDAAVEHAAARFQGGKVLAEHQLVQQMITRMSVGAQAGRLLCQEAARLKDAGSPRTLAATCVAKYHASVTAMQAASDAVQVLGARGFAVDAAVGRYFRDAKVMEVIEGSTQIQESLIAQDARLNRGAVVPGDEEREVRDRT